MEVVPGEVLLQLEQGSSDVLVRNLYLSADPYMRHRINGVQGSYIPPFTPGQVHFYTLTYPDFVAIASLLLRER